jgi:hypothetical protein
MGKAGVLAVGVAIGVALMAVPASSHVFAGGADAVTHLVDHMKSHFFTKSQSDKRYANAVKETDKARNAEKLDGIDSTGFVLGGGALVRARGSEFFNGGTTGLVGITGIGSVAGNCAIAKTAKVLFSNSSGAEIEAWWTNKDGTHFATVGASGQESQIDITTPSMQDDLVVLHVSAAGKAATFTAAQHLTGTQCEFSSQAVGQAD